MICGNMLTRAKLKRNSAELPLISPKITGRIILYSSANEHVIRPPKANSDNNFLDGENGNLFLRSKEDYKRLYNEGKLQKYNVCKALVE